MLQLGPIPLDLPAVQAALSGYSDLAMRRVARAHGAPFAFHEVVLDQLVLTPGKASRRILSIPEDDHPVGGQLMGSEPRTFGRAAKELVAAGYDLVDINFGCPVPRILNRSRGGFLLGEPETALAIVEGVLQAVQGDAPVMVKMRRGIDDSVGAERDFFRILEGAFERGVVAITVHGRTVEQRYIGPSRWGFLKRVKQSVGDRTILGSGDLFSPFAVRQMLAETGVDGVTVARGCIGNPFVFAQVRELLGGAEPRYPSLLAQRAALWMHWQEALALYGAKEAVAYARPHAVKYARLHPAPALARDRLVRVKSITDFEREVGELYDERLFTDAERALRAEDAARLVDGAATSCVAVATEDR